MCSVRTPLPLTLRSLLVQPGDAPPNPSPDRSGPLASPGKNILAILRHLGRIKEVRGNHLVRYVVQ